MDTVKKSGATTLPWQVCKLVMYVAYIPFFPPYRPTTLINPQTRYQKQDPLLSAIFAGSEVGEAYKASSRSAKKVCTCTKLSRFSRGGSLTDQPTTGERLTYLPPAAVVHVCQAGFFGREREIILMVFRRSEQNRINNT